MTRTRLSTPLEHPGPAASARRTSLACVSTSRRVSLPPGARLVEAMAAAIEALGASSGQVELLAGSLARVSYCFPALCPDGASAVTYSPAHEAVAPARLVLGSATVGFRDGQRFAHCHAAWFDADGELRGGHLWPETLIGPGPVEAVVHALDRVELISATDPETRLPVFTPQPSPARGTGGAVRAVISRLAPGLPIDLAVREIISEHGFRTGSINGSLGSIVGAVLHRRDSVLVVDGPATEVILTGEFDLDSTGANEIHLSGMVIDRFGLVHVGEFASDENLVAVTLELLVEEIPR